MEVERARPDFAAIVTGVDMNQLNEAGWRDLYNLWLGCHVLVVRGQTFTIPQFLEHGRRFGRLKAHRVKRTRHQDYPELTVMGLGTRTAAGKVDESVYTRGANWHTDGPWDQEVCKATQLYGLAIPSRGGDTLFANMHASYEQLPAALKARIRDLEAEYVYGGRTKQGIDLLDPEDRELPAAVHPVARVHSETGRVSLFLNPVHFVRFKGMGQQESDALADELFQYLVPPGNEYRHKWQVGDYILWDNRCLLHAATGGYPIEEQRIHWRATIME